MPQLNLLPWREQRRQRKNKQVIIAAALSLAVTLLVAIAVWGYLRQINHKLTLANDLLIEKDTLLQSAINKDKSIKQSREATVAQLAEVERLAHHRDSFVNLWSELTSVIPKTMYLTSIENQQGSLVFHGKSRASSEVSKLVIYLQQNPAIQQAQVKYIKKPQSAAQTTSYNGNHNQSTVERQVSAAAEDPATNSHHFDFEVVAILFEQGIKNNDPSQTASIDKAIDKEAGL